MAKKQTIKGSAIQVDPGDLASLKLCLRIMAQLVPEEVSAGAWKASQRLATSARAGLAASGKWGALVAPSVRSSKAREPLVRAGGSGQARQKHSPGDANSYGDLFFGAEYGVKANPKWPGHPWKGSGRNAGYGLWPAINRDSAAIYSLWTQDLIDALEREWSHG